MAGTLILAGGAYVVRARLVIESLAPPMTRYVSLSAGFTAVALAMLVRSRIVPRRPSDDLAVWWRVNLPRALAVWALLDGAAVLGAVTHILTGDLVAYAILVAGAMAGFLLWTPARLAGE